MKPVKMSVELSFQTPTTFRDFFILYALNNIGVVYVVVVAASLIN